MAYFRVQSRLEGLRAKNVRSRRRRRALFAQLRVSTGLKILSLVNVQHPCTSTFECLKIVRKEGRREFTQK